MDDTNPTDPNIDGTPPPAPLPYRSAAADRRDWRDAASRKSGFGAGCLVSLFCFIVLILMSLQSRGGDWAVQAWIFAGPVLLAIGVGIGARRRNWGFFFGALASVILVLSLIGLIFAICR